MAGPSQGYRYAYAPDIIQTSGERTRARLKTRADLSSSSLRIHVSAFLSEF